MGERLVFLAYSMGIMRGPEEAGGGFGHAQGLGLTLCGPQCCLACHKKCLETLAIQCGHKKLQGRLQLFGQDFSRAALGTPDGIPFIVKKCLCEIEQRALRTKVPQGGEVIGGQRGEKGPAFEG